MSKGIIYYSDNRLEGSPFENILRLSRESIAAASLPIVCCSLKPTDFGDTRIVLEGRERGYDTMVLQIIAALKASTADYVYFCEHDVLYHPSHFDFTPPADYLYFYNINNWRWLYPEDYLITYSGLTSLSMMCCNREMALRHYSYRWEIIEKFVFYDDKSKEPKWGRRMGYEPGTKPRRRGGVSDEEHVKIRSALPNIDVRHSMTFSAPKCHLEDFKHPPSDFVKATMDEIPGWDLRGGFGL